MAVSRLHEVVEDIFAHFKDRYDTTLRPGKASLTYNEVAGIIARGLNMSTTQTLNVEVEMNTTVAMGKLHDLLEFAERVKRAIEDAQGQAGAL